MSVNTHLDHSLVTSEDLARADDRVRVGLARTNGRRWQLMWLLAGPGVLAMLGENDGPSMLSYIVAGTRYGLRFFLPFVIVLFGMAFVCQEMCMRIGAVTHRGYGQLVRERFGPLWGWFAAGDLAVTNVVTLISEFVAIRIGLAYFHVGALAAAVLGVALVVVSASGRRYRRWERIVLALAVFNSLFLIAALTTRLHPAAGPLTAAGDAGLHDNLHTTLLLIASTIGATVTPWMVFFQQSASVDKGMTSQDISHGRIDTGLGAAIAALFGCGALIPGAALAGRGLPADGPLSGVSFPSAFADIFGRLSGTVIALGLVEAGALAVLTISASTAYAAGECVNAAHSFNSTPRKAVLFHSANLVSAVIAAVVILIPGAPLLEITLNANVFATVLAPVALIFVLMLGSDAELMGPWRNKTPTNWVGAGVIALVSLGGIAYVLDSFISLVGAAP